MKKIEKQERRLKTPLSDITNVTKLFERLRLDYSKQNNTFYGNYSIRFINHACPRVKYHHSTPHIRTTSMFQCFFDNISNPSFPQQLLPSNTFCFYYFSLIITSTNLPYYFSTVSPLIIMRCQNPTIHTGTWPYL